MDRAAVNYSAEQRIVDEGRHLATDSVINNGDREGDGEMKKNAHCCRFLPAVECGGAECAAGDGLQKPLDRDALGFDQG